MIRFIRLLIKRLLILALVSALAYFTAFAFFPYIDQRFPTLVALFLSYCFLAYVGIPMIIRIFRMFDQPNHVPQVSSTSDGWPSDPINIAILALSERDFTRAMKKAGWHKSDDNSLFNLIREGWAVIFNRSYPKAPLSKLYLFGRKQDISFQIPVGSSPRHRHHVRFWKVTHESLLDLHEDHEHKGFWQKLFKRFWRPDLHLWVGAAIYDTGPVAIRWRNGQITHLVNPDADLERDFIIESLQRANILKNIVDIKAGKPYRGRGQAIGMTIISDGFVKLCEIKRQLLPSRRQAVQESLALKSPKKR